MSQSNRWIVAFVISLIIFCNHYTRDVVGTLEKQMEIDLPMTTEQYANMSSLFFGPNIVAPLLVGVVMKQFGNAAKLFTLICLIAAVGHSIYSFGYYINVIGLLYAGRAIAGTMYEMIDTFPVIILRPLFGSDSWSTVIGLVNSSLRLGSVACFLFSPIIYRQSNVAMAFAVAAGIAWLGFACSFVGYYLQNPDAVGKLSQVNQDIAASDDIDNIDDDANGIDDTQHGNPMLDIVDEKPFQPSPMKTVSDQEKVMHNHKRDRAPLQYSKVNQGDDDVDSVDDVDDKSQPKSHVGDHNESLIKNVFGMILEWFPLHKLDTRYYFYVLSAAFMYGSMVPFWFSGSKFLQNHYSMDIQSADALMLVPELEMVLFSPILGYLMDKYAFGAATRLRCLSLSCLLMPASYLVLLNGVRSVNDQANSFVLIPPILPLLAIGVGFVLSHGFIWFSIMLIFPAEHFEFCSGFICSAINVFPTLIPPIVVFIYKCSNPEAASDETSDNTAWILWALVVSGCFASLFASAAICSSGSPSDVPQDIEFTSQSVP